MPTKLFILGDSISIHYGTYLKELLSSDFIYSRKSGEEKALENLDNPLGANGGSSALVLSFLESALGLGEIDAELLLVNAGLHDIRRDPQTGEINISEETYQENLEKIVSSVKSHNKQLVWIRTTPCYEEIHNQRISDFHRFSKDCIHYNQIADDVMKKNGVPSIDLYTFCERMGKEIYYDHVHFSEEVRNLQAAFISGWLNAWKATSFSKKQFQTTSN